MGKCKHEKDGECNRKDRIDYIRVTFNYANTKCLLCDKIPCQWFVKQRQVGAIPQ